MGIGINSVGTSGKYRRYENGGVFDVEGVIKPDGPGKLIAMIRIPTTTDEDAKMLSACGDQDMTRVARIVPNGFIAS